MSEHEKLKWICDKIGCEIKIQTYKNNTFYNRFWNVCDVREIIFTQEFMDKFKEYYYKEETEIMPTDYIAPILFHLNNPVDYLHNLINNGTHR